MALFLVGYMGCGKSTLGRKIAKSIGWQFIDMDNEIVQRAGMSVNEIFQTKGEAAFRDMERDLLVDLVAKDMAIIATGGGVPCHGDNMEFMTKNGSVVYLKVSVEKLVERLIHGREKRPIIREFSDEQLWEFVERNLNEREPYYLKATMTIDNDHLSDENIIRHVRSIIE